MLYRVIVTTITEYEIDADSPTEARIKTNKGEAREAWTKEEIETQHKS